MKLKPKHTIAEHFDDIEDIRIERGKKHQLIDIITIAAWCAKPSGNPTSAHPLKPKPYS